MMKYICILHFILEFVFVEKERANLIECENRLIDLAKIMFRSVQIGKNELVKCEICLGEMYRKYKFEKCLTTCGFSCMNIYSIIDKKVNATHAEKKSRNRPWCFKTVPFFGRQ